MKLRLEALLLALACAAAGCASLKKPPETGDFEGVVYDLDKAPVEGARIVLRGGDAELETWTNAQGRFTLPGVAPGDYELAFSKSMYESRSMSVTFGDFQEAVYLQASGYWQLLERALDALGRKEWDEAAGYLSRADGIQAASPTALFLKGALAEKRGDYAAALIHVQDAIKLDPRSPYLWLYLADLRSRGGGGPALEREALERYLELRDDPRAAERLGKLEDRR